ncbi:hypothetical protein [Streptomyces noursei]|uniref:hypothetical protein n=1 Tax=Streptomyces noursei TaxID=1971 RepID=UPI001676DCCB|nr:hypothetical protein [Streptomyces noursei]MCZ1021198.1 hypothetical protein [Streptomyces noursei]
MNGEDQFRRIRIIEHEIPRAQGLIAQYHAGLAHQHEKIADLRYELGRIDERTGDTV